MFSLIKKYEQDLTKHNLITNKLKNQLKDLKNRFFIDFLDFLFEKKKKKQFLLKF